MSKCGKGCERVYTCLPGCSGSAECLVGDFSGIDPLPEKCSCICGTMKIFASGDLDKIEECIKDPKWEIPEDLKVSDLLVVAEEHTFPSGWIGVGDIVRTMEKEGYRLDTLEDEITKLEQDSFDLTSCSSADQQEYLSCSKKEKDIRAEIHKRENLRLEIKKNEETYMWKAYLLFKKYGREQAFVDGFYWERNT